MKTLIVIPRLAAGKEPMFWANSIHPDAKAIAAAGRDQSQDYMDPERWFLIRYLFRDRFTLVLGVGMKLYLRLIGSEGKRSTGAHLPDSYHLLPERWEHCLRGHSRVCAHIMVRAGVRLTLGGSSFARPPFPIQNCSRSSVGDRVPGRGTSLTGSVRSLSIYSTRPLVAPSGGVLWREYNSGMGNTSAPLIVGPSPPRTRRSRRVCLGAWCVSLRWWADGLSNCCAFGHRLFLHLSLELAGSSAIARSLARRSLGANCVRTTSPSLASPSCSYHAASFQASM